MTQREDRIELWDRALQVARAIASVSDEGAGATSLFIGTTRAQRRAGGAELMALEYEAYAPMAIRQMAEIVANARLRWSLAGVTVLHRIGRVAIGEASVVVAVSSAHRAEAFAACPWVMDALKREAPIWKKEIWSDGAERWVGGKGE